MPRANQYLLLYLLDLLSVFARKSDKNLMTPASASFISITSLIFDAVLIFVSIIPPIMCGPASPFGYFVWVQQQIWP